MKRLSFLPIVLLFLAYSCEKSVDLYIQKPQDISILSGDNQTGYPGDFLPDSIVLEITPENVEDIINYSWYFESDHYMSVTSSQVKDDKLYLAVRWILNGASEKESVKFYLTQKCENYYNPSICRKIDSITLTGFTKKPWVKLYSVDWGDLRDMHFKDEHNGILIGDLAFSPGYLKTIDGGETWSYIEQYRKDLYQLVFADKDTGLVIVTNNYAYFTNDGGFTFHEGEWTVPIIGHESSSDYFMFNSKELITVGRYGAIAKTTDGGKSWETYQGLTFQNFLRDLECPDRNTCYACGDIGKIVKTSNRGSTWIEQDVLINNDLTTLYFIDPENGFAGGRQGALIKTVNGGKNWEILNSGLRAPIMGIRFFNVNHGYIVSSAGEIGETQDGGRSWELINKSSYGVFDLHKVFIRDNVIWGLQGSGLYSYTISNN